MYLQNPNCLHVCLLCTECSRSHYYVIHIPGSEAIAFDVCYKVALFPFICYSNKTWRWGPSKPNRSGISKWPSSKLNQKGWQAAFKRKWLKCLWWQYIDTRYKFINSFIKNSFPYYCQFNWSFNCNTHLKRVTVLCLSSSELTNVLDSSPNGIPYSFKVDYLLSRSYEF